MPGALRSSSPRWGACPASSAPGCRGWAPESTIGLIAPIMPHFRRWIGIDPAVSFINYSLSRYPMEPGKNGPLHKRRGDENAWTGRGRFPRPCPPWLSLLHSRRQFTHRLTGFRRINRSPAFTSPAARRLRRPAGLLRSTPGPFRLQARSSPPFGGRLVASPATAALLVPSTARRPSSHTLQHFRPWARRGIWRSASEEGVGEGEQRRFEFLRRLSRLAQ